MRPIASSTAASCPALRAGPSRRPDPYRCQKACPLSQGRSSHHRQPPAGPLCWRRLRPCPRGHRRRHAAGLRRGAGGRAAGHGDWLPEPGCGLAQWPRRQVSAGHDGQRSCLRLSQLCQGLQGLGQQAHPHQALHPSHQRQGRAVWPPADFVYIQTLCREWTDSLPIQNSDERNRWLPRYLSIYTGSRSTQPSAGVYLSSTSRSSSADRCGRHNT